MAMIKLNLYVKKKTHNGSVVLYTLSWLYSEVTFLPWKVPNILLITICTDVITRINNASVS